MQSNIHLRSGAQLIAQQLEAIGVRYVFGIPGAKIDRLFDAIEDTKIQMIPVRHEANGAFMAGIMGRLSGRAGVTLATSGPGCGNLVTGVATANSEGDPMIAIGGAVKRDYQQKQTHQSMDTVSIFRSITKYSAEIQHVDATSEIMANAFRLAESGRQGACFISVPQDVLADKTSSEIIIPSAYQPTAEADPDSLQEAVERIQKAQRCVVLLGLHASHQATAEAVSAFLHKTQLPVVGTYQAAGAVDINYYHHFAGRVGLFNNQPGDVLLKEADLIITIGFNPIEYDPELWNSQRCPIVHNAYNMVEMQEVQKYHRAAGVKFGPIDFKAYAESFGARGYAITQPDQLLPTLRQAMEVEGPAVVAIPVDYSDNPKLMQARTEANQDPVFQTLEGVFA
ncbi:TPA: thiamine pyrophosphate-binding protein [Vibrio cholerae]